VPETVTSPIEVHRWAVPSCSCMSVTHVAGTLVVQTLASARAPFSREVVANMMDTEGLTAVALAEQSTARSAAAMEAATKAAVDVRRPVGRELRGTLSIVMALFTRPRGLCQRGHGVALRGAHADGQVGPPKGTAFLRREPHVRA